MAIRGEKINSLLGGGDLTGGGLSVDDFLNQISASTSSANQATEAGLKLLHDAGYTPSDAASLWNDAFGTKFTAEDYTTSLNNYGIEKVAKPQIAVFGDSISSSVGYALDGKGGGYSDTTYGNNLAQYLGQSLKVNAANNSMGGTTTSDSLTGTGVPYAGSALPIEYGNFAKYITENKPETAVLRFGAADAIRLNNADTTLKNIEEMVKVSEANGTKPILVGVTPFAKMGDFNAGNIDAGITDSMIASANAINKGIQDLASKYGVQFIDVRQVPVTQGALLDGVHPSGEYGAALNNYISNEIKDAGVFKQATKAAEPTAMSVAPQTLAPASTKEITFGLLSQTPQAVASPVASQASSRVIPTAHGTVIEGDDIEAKIAGVPQVVYETRVDPNNTANWQTFNPKTGEIIDSGTFAGGGSKGLLEASRPVLALAASVLGAPYLSSLIGGATGLTGSALAGATGATIAGGSTALTGGSLEDTLKAALIGGGGAYAGNALNNYLDVGTTDVGITERQFAIQDAKQLADQGLTTTQIRDAMSSGGYNDAIIDRALTAITPTNVATSSVIPSTDAVNVVGQSVTPSLSNLISTIATIPSTTPTQVTAPSTTQTVNVTAQAPQQVDQKVLDLVNSQIASNVTTPSNLANVEVTAPKTTTTQDIVNAITSIIPTATTPTTTPLAEQTITSNKPATVQDIVTALTSTIPITNAQATYVAEQVISSNRPVTTQDVINAITSVIPTVTPTTIPTTVTSTPEVKVTAPKTVTTQDIINAIATVVPTAVTPPVIPTQTVIAERPSSITDAVTAATIPLIQPTTPLTPTEVKAQTELTNTEKIRLAQLGLTAAGLLSAGAAVSGGPTQYDIVPVPTDWTSPQTIAATYNYPRPIDFGNRNLLMGTQWEKFLDPNYGRVPEPTIYSQPSNLSYSDLMGILGNKQGMPSSSNLSINDIISGIQNQYGQVPSRTMG